MAKCPVCGNDTFGEVYTEPDCRFILATLNIKTKQFDSGMPINAFGCTNCHAVMLTCDELTIKPEQEEETK